MLLAIAWRNIWRNARRSLFTMVALALGVAGLVSLHSYRETANAAIVRDITTGLLGHLQVHGSGYQEAPALGTLVKDPVQVEAALQGALPGALAERRVLGAGLAGSGERSAPVAVMGLQPGTTSLYRLASGAELSRPGEVLLGVDLARELEVREGGELVLVSQALDGSVANDRYTVVGTFTSPSAELDATAVVMALATAQDFFGLGDGVHQLVVRLPQDREDLSLEANALRAALDLQTLEALSWSEMLPELKLTIENKRKGQGVMDFIVFLIVGLGVFNAMTMSVFERTRELGVLGALGTRPRRLLGMVMLEALIQGLLAFAAGMALAWLIMAAIGSVDLGSVMQGDVMGVRMPTVLELGFSVVAVQHAAATAFFTAFLGALLPALRAARLNPVDALRHT